MQCKPFSHSRSSLDFIRRNSCSVSQYCLPMTKFKGIVQSTWKKSVALFEEGGNGSFERFRIGQDFSI